jgi:O-antigen/teichoic acid export membrane protein
VLLNAASLAVISRRFGTVDLGLYTLERRSMAFLQPLILLGLGVATPRFIARSLGRGSGNDVAYAWVGSVLVAAFAAGLSVVLFLFPGPTAAVVFGDSHQTGLARALAGFAFVTALFQIVYSVFRGYLRMTRANLLELLVVGALPLSLALVGPTDLVAFMWALNGGILAVTVASLPLGRLTATAAALTARTLPAMGRELLRFGLSRTPGDIAIVALFSIPPVAVVHFATAAEAGYTSVVISALNLVSVLAVPLGVLLLPRVAIAAGTARGIPRDKYLLLAQATLDLSLAFAAILLLMSPVLLRLLLPDVQPSVVTALQVGSLGLPGYVFYLVFRSYLDAVDTRPLSSYATLSGLACLLVTLAIALEWDLLPSPVAASAALSLSLMVTGGMTVRMVDKRLGSFATIRSVAPVSACCLVIAGAGVALRGAPSAALVGAGVAAAFGLGLLFHATGRPWLLELRERIRAASPRSRSAAA